MDWIAIKTAEMTTQEVDLLSEGCPIRYSSRSTRQGRLGLPVCVCTGNDRKPHILGGRRTDSWQDSSPSIHGQEPGQHAQYLLCFNFFQRLSGYAPACCRRAEPRRVQQQGLSRGRLGGFDRPHAAVGTAAAAGVRAGRRSARNRRGGCAFGSVWRVERKRNSRRKAC